MVVANRPKVVSIIDRTDDAAADLNRVIEEIGQSPWLLFNEPDAEQLENQRLFTAARRFAEGARGLQETTAALQAAVEDPVTDRGLIEDLQRQLQTQTEQFERIQAE